MFDFDLILIFFILTISNPISSMPAYNSNTKRWQALFSDRCNVIQSKKLCPDLPQSCCCKDMKTSHSYLSTTGSNSGSSNDLITFCATVSKLPPIFPNKIQQLVLFDSQFSHFNESTLNKSQLYEITFFEILNDLTLTKIEKNSFAGLHRLKQIYIENVENLVYISESAFFDLPKLRTLTIKATGLTSVHGFSQIGVGPHFASQIEYANILLSHNRWLTKIPVNAFGNLDPRVTTIAISWNPSLKSVENYAFNGSHIRHLLLHNNLALSEFATHAFAGINGLSELTFENTAVDYLPTDGLNNLVYLNAFNVPNLMRFPKLKSLHKATLTYPYHCCSLLNDYGFGKTFENDMEETRNIVNCDTGEELDPTDEKDGGSWVSEPTYNDSDSYLEYASEGNSFNLITETDLLMTSMYNDSEFLYASGAYDIFSHFGNNYSESEYHYYSWEIRAEESNDDDILVSEPVAANRTVPVVRLCYKDNHGNIVRLIHENKIHCTPQPDKFNPCENLLGNQGITATSWIVALLAVFGNFFVVSVHLFVAFDHRRTHQRHLTVPKFLILNLAFADFCMGVYILTLSVMDRKTSENYFKYGVEWQTQGGCDILGFLSVFASQLSVYTLSVISLERWYAIRYAIQLDKRMTLKFGQFAMFVGWMVSIVLAALPVAGVNSYQKTAICLPMDVEKISGRIYLALLLSLDIIAFIIVVGSYWWMYALVKTANVGKRTIHKFLQFQRKKRNDDTRPKRKQKDCCYGALDNHSADTRIAKRMAVLVFTDFACFFPICFVSLVALGGHPMVTISTAKFFLVFVYPINSCTNPFLYAIMTKSFKKDVRSLTKPLRRFCFSDNVKKSSSRRKSSKVELVEERQLERRKTMHICLDVDHENCQADGFMSVEQKSCSSTTKTTYAKLNSTSSIANSRCNSISFKSSFRGKGSKKKNNSKKKRKFYSRALSRSVTSRNTVSCIADKKHSNFRKFLPKVFQRFFENNISVLNSQKHELNPQEGELTSAAPSNKSQPITEKNDKEKQFEMSQITDGTLIPLLTQNDSRPTKNVELHKEIDSLL